MNRWFDVFETEAGWMGLVITEKGVRSGTMALSSPDQCIMELGHELDGAEQSSRHLAKLRSRIQQYFAGKRTDFSDVVLDLEDAGPFQRAAWEATRTIPWGETRSYQWIAAYAGKPRAPRAAGQAMSRNRIPIIVPCHRVIASDGRLGGYGGGASGLALKRRLLSMEGAV
ncbi:MAG: methylated-DNA--[protein]-cysteine S-methyltransferase [Chloroflexi bacterium]|nr:methylated-DNA--[protein]-cysteine S-methyltransferase [Chloroflexota bacterium]